MTDCLLKQKRFYCREWTFSKLTHCLETRASSKTCGVLVVGGPGCGKTALCSEMVWPTGTGKQLALCRRQLAYHFCQRHDPRSLLLAHFVASIVRQLSESEWVPEYREEFLARPEIRNCLAAEGCRDDPDTAFREAILKPLAAIRPPPQNVFLLVDSLDETLLEGDNDASDATCGPSDGKDPGGAPQARSRSIAALLGRWHHLFPQWLLLISTVRKQRRSLTRLFTGFRKVGLDDLTKAHVVRDVQQYIMYRLDAEESLRKHLRKDTAEMFNQLHIKSNGCFLYLEKILDGIAHNMLTLREVREIPGTLNGLYLWLCQRLFPKNTFSTVRPIFEVMLASRRPLSIEELFVCVWTRDTTLDYDHFCQSAEAADQVFLVAGPDGVARILFHSSFAEWLQDVKHCTQKYQCRAEDGHRMLALSYTLGADRLQADEVCDLAFHLGLCGGNSGDRGLSTAEQALWLLYSGACVQECYSMRPADEGDVDKLLSMACCDCSTDVYPAVNSWYRQSMSSALDALIESVADLNECDNSGQTVLHAAAAEGRLDAVLQLVDRGADISAANENGQTALNLASRNGHSSVVSVLLRSGADVNHADNEGWTALRSAAWGGHSEVVSLLLVASAKVDHADNDERTALRAAAWGGHGDIVSILLASGANVNKVDNEGRTALTAAAYMGHRDIVASLLDNGAEVNHCDNDGRTALSVAALCIPACLGHTDVVKLLIQRGATVDHRDNEGATPLLAAAYEGQLNLCELLLDAGADVDAADNGGRTPFLAAVSVGHTEVVEFLMRHQAATDQIDAEGRTALSLAAQQGSVPIVRMLLDLGMDEMHRDNRGLTAMHLAAFEGHKQVVDMLIELGARLDETDNDGCTAVLLAAQEGHVPIVRQLIARNADIDRCSHNGRTPLRAACLYGHADVVEALVTHGADVNCKDADGRSTLYVLALDNRVAMAKVLLANGADAQATDDEGRSTLHVACWQGHTEMVSLLIKYGADVDAVDSESRTPLQSACWQGHASIADTLCQSGARVNHTCNQGATALCIAAQEGHGEVVKVLCNYNADPAYVDKFGRTAAKVAMKGGHTEICRVLEEYGSRRPVCGEPQTVMPMAERSIISRVAVVPLKMPLAEAGVFCPPPDRPHSDATASSVASRDSNRSVGSFVADANCELIGNRHSAESGNSGTDATSSGGALLDSLLQRRASTEEDAARRVEDTSFTQQLRQFRKSSTPQLHAVASEGAIASYPARNEFAPKRQTSLRSPVHMANPKIAQNSVFGNAASRSGMALVAENRPGLCPSIDDRLNEREDTPEVFSSSKKPVVFEQSKGNQLSIAMSPRMGRRRNGIRTNPNVATVKTQNGSRDNGLTNLVLAAPTQLLPVPDVGEETSLGQLASTGLDFPCEARGMANGSIIVRSAKTARIINPQKEMSPKAIGIVRPTAVPTSSRTKETLL